MATKLPKKQSNRFLEIRDPAKAIGLWSHHADYTSTLHLIDPTRQTLGKFFNADLARYETHAEALRMMAEKGWDKTPSRKMKEYAAQYLGERFDEAGNGWGIIEKTSYQDDPYERLVLSSTHGAFWQTVDAGIITELVKEKQLCLFEMEKSPIFDALTDPKNASEKMGKLMRHFEFFVHDPNGPKCIKGDILSDKKTAKIFTLEAPIVIGDEFKAMVAREFRRVAYTGTMGWRQKIVRPAHEVALGIWLARLQPAPSLPPNACPKSL